MSCKGPAQFGAIPHRKVRVESLMKKHLVLAALVAGLGSVGSASALSTIDLTADGTWFEFGVGDVGDTWRSVLDGDPLTFAFTSTQDFELRVVDVGFAGDRVEVFSNATSFGLTSSVPIDDTVFAFSAPEGFASPAVWSQRVLQFGPGSYVFSGTAANSPYGGATFGISAFAVPEPSQTLLMLSGLGLLGAMMHRRRKPNAREA
jgi:PEP-CTERM motif